MTNQRFYRGERLKSEKSISFLFSGKANSYAVFPVRIIWTIQEAERPKFPMQVTFSVPKRKFAKAPDRNLLKRRLRESYRLQKAELHEKLELAPNQQIVALFLYTDKIMNDYERIDRALYQVMKRLPKEVRRYQRKQAESTPSK